MSITSKIFFLITIFISFSVDSNAQDKKMEFSATLGFVANHEDLATDYQEFTYGRHLGFNLYARKTKRFKGDLQLSINFSTKNNSSSSLLSVNGLYGGRYYFIDPDKSTTAFANALIGGAFIFETGGDYTEALFGIGYSAGCFVSIKRFIVGVSAESYNNFIFKIGYTF